MAAQHRGAVLAGEEIIIRAVFTDDTGGLVDLDAVPDIYIYDEDVEEATIEAEADAQVYTSALAGPLSATRLSTGYYTYTYTVPAGSDAGTWHDLWVGTINTIDDYEIFSFTVTRGFNASEQRLSNNMLVVIELSSDITNSDGDEALVAITLGYATVYSPLYASPDLIRLEMGRWIDYIPDSTLALMAHLSSKEANFIHGPETQSWGNIQLARTKFVVFDTVWRCLNIPGQGQQAGYSTGKKKALGDLSITGGDAVVEVPEEIYDYVREQRDAWWRVVNAGGNIVPGQGLAPTMAVKGIMDPDRRMTGRLWESPRDVYYPEPTANRKSRQSGKRRGRFSYGEYRRPGTGRGSLYRFPYRGTDNE
jgi:hypothetical protein